MSSKVFRHVTADEAAWRTELGADDPAYVELMWLDALLDDGSRLGIGLYRSRPYDGGRPAVTVNLLQPGLDFTEVHATFEPDDFTPLPFGGTWGEAVTLQGVLDPDGRPESFTVSLKIDTIEVELTCAVVCTGMKFTSASPGYTHHRPETGAAVGWWPLAPRADATGTIAVDGTSVPVSGRVHLEKQLSSLPLAGDHGAASAQSIWTWGHFTCGEYTGLWTDSAASEHLGFRHFTPFVLYRGSEPLLSTFAFASYVERFRRDPTTGVVGPEVVTLRANEGDRDLFARLVDGRVSDQFQLNGVPGAHYCRQVGRIEIELRHWGRTTRMMGDVVHEWGTQAGNFPFAEM